MEHLKHDLTTGSITREMVRFSAPILLSYLLQALYGLADTIIVSFFSDMNHVISVTQGSQVTFVFTSFILGLAGGGMVLIAQYAGAADKTDLKQAIQSVFTVFVLLAVMLTAVMLGLTGWCTRVLNIPPEARIPCKAYLDICLSGTLFVFLYNGISVVLQALGDSKHPLIFVGIACIVNIGLDLLLVGVWQMGAPGAAYATVFSQFVSVASAVVFLKRRDFPFAFRLGSLRLYGGKVRTMFRVGLPYAFQRTVVALSFLFISGLSNEYGTLAAAGAGIVAKINNVATLPFAALNLAMAAMCGQNLGGGKAERAQAVLFAGMKLMLFIGAVLFAALQAFPAAVLGIFSAAPELIAAATPFLRWFSFCYLLFPFSYAVNGLMTGSGQTVATMTIGLSAALVLRVPLAILFSKTLGLGYPGIALGASAAVLGSVAVAWGFYRSGIWMRPLLKSAG